MFSKSSARICRRRLRWARRLAIIDIFDGFLIAIMGRVDIVGRPGVVGGNILWEGLEVGG